MIEEVADATGESVARRFGYAYVDSFGTVTPAGPAPYLDCVAAPENAVTDTARTSRGWQVLKTKPRAGLSPTNSPTTSTTFSRGRLAELSKARDLVIKRLEGERDRLILDAAVAAEKGTRR